jgi:hypothetical protein
VVPDRQQSAISAQHAIALPSGNRPVAQVDQRSWPRSLQHGTLVDAKADNDERQLFSGTNADIAEDLRVLRELGVAAVDFNFPGATYEVVVAAMRQFHDQVLARRG